MKICLMLKNVKLKKFLRIMLKNGIILKKKIEPIFTVYFQGGLTWYHAKLGILMSLQKLYERNLVNIDELC